MLSNAHKRILHFCIVALSHFFLLWWSDPAFVKFTDGSCLFLEIMQLYLSHLINDKPCLNDYLISIVYEGFLGLNYVATNPHC
jgi:hypothetical protein